MKLKKQEYNNSKYALWLIKVSIVIGVLTFSGFNVNVYTSLQQATKTELLFSERNVESNDVFLFKKSVNKLVSIKHKLIANNVLKFARLDYSQKLKTAFQLSNKNFLSYKYALIKAQLKFPKLDTEIEFPIAALG